MAQVQTAQIVVHSRSLDQESAYYQACLQPAEYESKQLQTHRNAALLWTCNFDHCWQSWNKWTMRCGRRMTNVCARFGWLGSLILTVGFTLGLGSNQHVGFTFLLPAGSTECFFQTTARNDNMEVEYQVNPRCCQGLDAQGAMFRVWRSVDGSLCNTKSSEQGVDFGLSCREIKKKKNYSLLPLLKT